MSLTFSPIAECWMTFWRDGVLDPLHQRWRGFSEFHRCRRTVVGGSVCWVRAKRVIVWDYHAGFLCFSPVWLLFPKPRPSRAAPPRCSNPGVLMWFAALFELTQLPAQSQKCEPDVSFFQLLRHFKGVVKHEKMFSAVSFKKAAYPFILMSRK